MAEEKGQEMTPNKGIYSASSSVGALDMGGRADKTGAGEQGQEMTPDKGIYSAKTDTGVLSDETGGTNRDGEGDIPNVRNPGKPSSAGGRAADNDEAWPNPTPK